MKPSSSKLLIDPHQQVRREAVRNALSMAASNGWSGWRFRRLIKELQNHSSRKLTLLLCHSS